MTEQKQVANTMIRVVRDDLTALEVESIVFYAQPDLKLGTGYGNAISLRGGPKIQEELDQLAPKSVGDVVVTSGGKLKIKHIIHAVGPAFQEQDIDEKLRQVTLNTLKSADEKGIGQLAMPPLGTGFYGVTREDSARVTLQAIGEYLKGQTQIKEIVICVRDPWDIAPLSPILESMS